MYKAKIRIPKEQFAFIEVEAEGTLEEINEVYKQMSLAPITDGFGLEDKEWRSCLDGYLNSGEMESNCYERMSLNQKMVIQEIKKSFKRIKSKIN